MTRTPAKPPSAPVPAGASYPALDWPERHVWAAALVLVAAVVIVYARVWHAGFIWDDEMHLTQNPTIIGPLGLKEIWTTRAARYFPLVLTTFWTEHALWGLNPVGYHAVNVALHAAGALVLWRVLRSLQVRGAWFGAALWALHPVQVETVAWITELKNTQSGLFFFLAALFFIRWAEDDREGRARPWAYAAALGASALAMASKSSTTILPLILGLCAWRVQGRLKPKVIVRLVPVLLLSAVAAALTLWTQHLEGANEARWNRGLGERIAGAGRVVWFYLGKLAWPHPLIFIYPRWKVDPGSSGAYVPLVLALALLAVLWAGRRGKFGPVFLAFGYFFAALLPVLGILDQYFWRYSFVGDHFQYLASVGPLALAGAALTAAFAGVSPAIRAVLAGVLLALLGAASWVQTADYSDIDTLWRATIARNPTCWMALNNLGSDLLEEGRPDEAAAILQRAVAARADDAEAHYNLANAWVRLGRTEAALSEFNQAIALDPDFSQAHNNLGSALLGQGQVEGAVSQFERALAIDPKLADAYTGLGNARLRQGRLEEAIASYSHALALVPNSVPARMDLGAALLAAGRPAEAAGAFREALARTPRSAPLETDLGNALLQLGKPGEAAEHYRAAIALDPSLPDCRNNLGFILAQEGRTDEAIQEYRRAIELRPDFADAHRNLAAALFRKGLLDEANAEYGRALQGR